MELAFTVRVKNGQVGIEGPIDDVPLCLNLLPDAMKVLAVRMRQRQAESADVKPTLYLPDGTPAPQSGLN